MDKNHLVETTQVKPNEYKKQAFLNESEQTVMISEKAGEKVEYTAKAIYTFPISKPNQENLNGRVYNNKLWENTIKRLNEVSTFGLMDHPKTEGSTKDIWCVWRNLRFNESKKLVVADAYLIGDHGKQVLEILEAGGQIGLSTSGFGDFLEDKKTIDPESYELERVADFVFNPSYEVFGSQENLSIKTEKIETIKEEEVKMENKKEEIDEKVEKKTDFVTKSFKANIAFSFKNAKKLEKAQERIENYTDLLTYLEEGVADDLKKQIEETLKTEIENLETRTLTENTELIEGLKTEVADLTKTKDDLEEKFKNATDLLDSLKVYSTKLKEMYEITSAEKNGMITATEYRESQIYITKVEKDNEEFQSEINNLKKRLTETRKERRIPEKVETTKEETKEEEKIEENYDNVPQAIMNYYNDLEYSTPGAIKIKEDILKCRTLMEAQRTYLRLKSLLNEETSSYDRKSVMDNNVYVELKQKKLPRKKGWV